MKLMVLHRQILFSLAIADFAEAILMRTSAEQVPSLHRVAPRYLKLAEILAVKANICTDVIRSVGHDLTLFSADFHSICRCSVYESVGEVLEFDIAAAHRIDVVGKS